MKKLNSRQRASALILAIGAVLAIVSALGNLVVSLQPPPASTGSNFVVASGQIDLVPVIPGVMLAVLFLVSFVFRVSRHRGWSLTFAIVILPIWAFALLVAGFTLGSTCQSYGAGAVTMSGCRGTTPAATGLAITAAMLALAGCAVASLASIVVGAGPADTRQSA